MAGDVSVSVSGDDSNEVLFTFAQAGCLYLRILLSDRGGKCSWVEGDSSFELGFSSISLNFTLKSTFRSLQLFEINFLLALNSCDLSSEWLPVH